MSFIFTILKGIVIGIANVIPGVSGGTLAFVLGIYEKLTGAVGDIFIKKENRLNNLIFLSKVGIGVIIGIVLFAKAFTIILENPIYTQYTYIFFVGLILGSVPFILNIHDDMKSKADRLFWLLFAIVLILAIGAIGTEQVSDPKSTEITGEFLGVFKLTDFNIFYGLWLTLCALLAAGSMVLPGFSGSALLITLGEYNNVLYFVDQRMLYPLIFIALGAAPGIVLFAKLINLLMKKYPPQTYYFILGLIAASVIQIAIEISKQLYLGLSNIIFSLVFLVLGLIISLLLSRINNK